MYGMFSLYAWGVAPAGVARHSGKQELESGKGYDLTGVRVIWTVVTASTLFFRALKRVSI